MCIRDSHTTTPAKHRTQPSCQRLSPCSAGRYHTTPQPPPSTALSHHVSGCRPAVQADVIPHHNPAGVTVEASGEMCRDVSCDLVFPLFLWRVERTTPTVWTFCPRKAFWQTGVVHATHVAKPSHGMTLFRFDRYEYVSKYTCARTVRTSTQCTQMNGR